MRRHVLVMHTGERLWLQVRVWERSNRVCLEKRVHLGRVPPWRCERGWGGTGGVSGGMGVGAGRRDPIRRGREETYSEETTQRMRRTTKEKNDGNEW